MPKRKDGKKNLRVCYKALWRYIAIKNDARSIMTSKTKYIILALAISAFGTLIFISNESYSPYSIIFKFEYSRIIFGIGVILFVLYNYVRKWPKIFGRLMIYTFGTCLVLNIYLVTEYYQMKQSRITLSEYLKLRTCDMMENRFATDLKNGEIKYFQFGMGTDLQLQKTLKAKYGIESFGMGCCGLPNMECYNNLVNEYLKRKYNDKIVDD